MNSHMTRAVGFSYSLINIRIIITLSVQIIDHFGIFIYITYAPTFIPNKN